MLLKKKTAVDDEGEGESEGEAGFDSPDAKTLSATEKEDLRTDTAAWQGWLSCAKCGSLGKHSTPWRTRYTIVMTDMIITFRYY